ncbi:uncharacterized protein LOC129916052 [Episyrphus balteatus]|uniref:uncharacterized protein LOC129916052 n=1 Tax=Episyrphus balteatus TaxID=286459 RepID=UPI0024867335|nr:uncharacterized protein LOC129916052 [Episyrphus balteatus]
MEKIAILSIIFLVGATNAFKLSSKCSNSTTSQLLPNVDINYFSFCDVTTGRQSVEKCDEGLGFLVNSTVSGCVPFEKWPEPCIAQVPAVPKCVGNNVNRPSSATNPNKYYLCPREGLNPILMTCPEGKGFVNVPGTIGCAEYSKWRAIKNCPS